MISRLTCPLKAALTALSFFLLSNADAQLCIPSYVNGCSTGIGLNSIYFIGTTTSALTDLNTGCGGTNGYDDRTATSVTMNPGTAPTATFNTISGTANMQAWIDFNNDGSFSSSESIGGANGFTSSGTTASLTIPSTAATGTHILRFSVTASDSYPNINPCPTGSTYISGETHDYTVFIGTASPTCAAVTGLTAGGITATTATISWNAVTGSAGYEYIVNQTAGNPTGTGAAVTGTSAVVSSLSAGTVYYAHVRNKCNATSFSVWATKSFTTPSGCDTPASVSIARTSATSATASWTAITGAVGYEYAVNQTSGNPTGPGTPVAATTTALNALSTGATYYFHLRTKCGATSFSAWSVKAFKAGATAVVNIEGGNGNLNVFPNPTTGALQVNVAGQPAPNAAIRITDIAGRLLKNIPVSTTQVKVDMQDATPGLYFLKYSDDKGTEVIKIRRQ